MSIEKMERKLDKLHAQYVAFMRVAGQDPFGYEQCGFSILAKKVHTEMTYWEKKLEEWKKYEQLVKGIF